jgi:hypothetical protein
MVFGMNKVKTPKTEGEIERVLNTTTTIVISRELRNELAKKGKKDDSFEDIIWRLLDDTKG